MAKIAHIPMNHICTKVVDTDGNNTVADVAQFYKYLPEKKRHNWFMIVHLGDDRFATLGFEDLLEATGNIGAAIRERPLSDIPGLKKSKVMEREGQGYGRARHARNRSHKRRLVVLESGAPIGLLMDVELTGGFGGFVTTLFGQAEQSLSNHSQLQIRCPFDNQMYNFADLIDLESNKLVCPQGHIIEE
jgi:hypothetical protein